MHELIHIAEKRKRRSKGPTDEWTRLRRGLLLSEREKTRVQGRRSLEHFVTNSDPDLSSVAMAGLASSYFWSNDYQLAMNWCKQVMVHFPMSISAIWCSSLLVNLFRMLGMKRERFEAERERIRMMRKIAFQSESREDKIYVLNELLKEFDARDMNEDVQKYAEELEDLVNANTRLPATALI